MKIKNNDHRRLMSKNKKLFKNLNQLYIYGTGSFANDIFEVLINNSIEIQGFIDHSARQKVFKGFEVFQPDYLPLEARKSSTVVIGIHNPEARTGEIIDRLFSMEYGQIITPIELYDSFGKELGDRYWLTSRSFYEGFVKEIETARNLLSDRFSRDLFQSILHFRLSGNYHQLPAPQLQVQYLPPDLPTWKLPMRLMDCGAFTGDTLESMLAKGILIEAYAAYEPDKLNFQNLVETISHSKVNQAFLWPCGVFSTTTQLRFSTGRGQASLISNDGETTIQCVSLDDSAPHFLPTLIKMDIEGAEYDALLGAEKLIAASQPGLAICVYHSPSHLWDIPLLINDIAQRHGIKYDYYLRTHCFNTFETVFYAIPSIG